MSKKRTQPVPGASFAPALGVVVAVALVVRMAFQLAFARTPFAHHLFLDAALYDGWATRLASGQGTGDAAYFFDPGFAWALALAKVAGLGAPGLRAAHVLLGVATCALTALITRRLAGDRAGLVAGVLVALYVPLAYFEGFVLKTTLEVFLGTLLLFVVLVAAERGRLAALLGCGLLAGITALVKSTLLLVIPALVAWACFDGWRRGRTRPWLPAAALALGAALPLMGTLARNRAVSGETVLLTTASGVNFYIGNGPHADGARREPPFIRPEPVAEEGDGLAEARRRAGRALTPAEASQFWWRESRAAIAADPARWMRLLVVKLRVLLHRYEITDNVSMVFVGRSVALLRAPLPGWWLAVPLAFAGIAGTLLARDRARWLLLAFIGAHVAGLLAFHVTDRYRIGVVPPVIALGVAACADAVRRRGRVAAIVGAAGAAGLVASCALPHPVYESGQSLANHHEMLGQAAVQSGDAAGGVAAFRAAAREAPALATPHFNLATALHHLAHDEVAALESADSAVRIQPTYGAAHFLRGEILEGLQRDPEAAIAYRDAARSGHRAIDAWRLSAAASGRAGDVDAAETSVREALAIARDDPDALEMLGNIHFLRGDRAAALATWERALALQPDDVVLRQNVERLRAVTP